MTQSRIPRIDNIKAILIMLVVLGHLCEVMTFTGSDTLYLLIYSFHMPAFVFISGYCSKKKVLKKLIRIYLYPYVIFQTLYLIFANGILGKEESYQYTTPYWILWYLVALFAWNLLIWCLPPEGKGWKLVLTIAIGLSLLIGYENRISYPLSLSRILGMAPFFLMGYYGKLRFPKMLEGSQNKKFKWIKGLSLLMVLSAIILILCQQEKLQASWAYVSRSYEALGYTVFHRVLFGITSVVWIAFLCIFVPNHPIPVLTTVGQRTLAIYLLHGFIIRFAGYQGMLRQLPVPSLCLVLIAIGMIGICGNRWANNLITSIMKGRQGVEK